MEVNEVNKNIVEELKTINFPNPGKIYDDENYEVWRTCSGEWGGTIYFKSKFDNKIYSATSTCPIAINKIKNIYYVSNTLNHMIGNSSILEIKNPKNMELKNEIPNYNYGHKQEESNSSNGIEKKLYSMGVSIITSFVMDDELYSIVTDYQNKKTNITKLENGNFVSVFNLPKNIFFNNTEPLILKENDNKLKIYFQGSKNGILKIDGRKLHLTYYEK